MVYSGIITNPFTLIYNFDIEKDIGILSDGAEIIESLIYCHFEKPFIDIFTFCSIEDCSIETIGNNLSKNMFVLVGKITSLTELFTSTNTSTEFMNNDISIWRDNMISIGDDIGTFIRVLINYHHIDDKK